jgi:multiple sugar transport system substrate-binding protein
MKKIGQKLLALILIMSLAACGETALPTATSAPPTATETPAPTATNRPLINFITPANGATLDYATLVFKIEPIAYAEGYTWSFSQNGQVLWNTIVNEQRLVDAEYQIPAGSFLYGKLNQGELLIQVKVRIKGVWSEPGALTVMLPERLPTATPSPIPSATLPPLATGLVEIRWFVGIGAGTTANQQDIERKVVRKFNESHPNIKLTLQVVEYSQASAMLTTQFREGTAPDIIGPMGWAGASALGNQWFDLSALIVDTNYDLSVFQPELVAAYKTERGQEGLPFAVYPAAIFYNKRLFENAGLNYPPKAYGDPYLLPDGTEVEWNWDTLADIARRLTLDSQGRNALDPEFDAGHIFQYGFVPQWMPSVHFATFWGANTLYDANNNAVIPPAWATAWKWYYDGLWGRQPFIPNQAASNTARFGSGDPFSSASIAMAITQSWYINPKVAGGQRWDLGALPSYNGVVHGRVDADTFRIWKGTAHPREAFEVLTYFLGPASTDLLRAYGGIPARTADQDAFFAARAQQYPYVKNWEVLKAGLNYPDIPSAEGYMPNYTEAWNRLTAFWNLLASNDTLSVQAEIESLRRDLDTIFKR